MLIGQYAADAESDAADSAVSFQVPILVLCAFGAMLRNATHAIDRATRHAE